MKKHSFITCSLLALTLTICFFTYINCIKRTQGFSLKKILSHHDYHSKWDIGPPTQEHKNLLNQIEKQPFYYLRSGKKYYAFISEDKKFVIKFFKQKHMQTQSTLNTWPLNKVPYLSQIQAAKIARRKHFRNQTYMSYSIAYHFFAQETGILYLQLNQTKKLGRYITLYPPKGRKITLDLGSMEFLIQKKTDFVFDYLGKLLKDGKIKEAKQAICSILNLISARIKNGICSFTTHFEQDIGFIDGRAHLINIGDLYLSPSISDHSAIMYRETYPLKEWLDKQNCELSIFLEKQIQNRHFREF